ncbi:SAM-dependent methyltransferase [Pyxidicoccus trucidator]|uniref:SAM-dependent methyltransferase n=1 Tax=Pyxidicoccus trucidator TaxID=2709662 RepID=UPI0013D8F873|nr:SAM-dependent methyltransferase [Pyxidicoccus trucidator]
MIANPTSHSTPGGRLVVVGTGIRTGAHLTPEAAYWVRCADKVFHVVCDPVSEALLRELNPRAESLVGLYAEGKSRLETYRAMIQRTVAAVEEGLLVCLAAYGHPGVFAWPTHESIRLARAKGYEATMLPGISTEDCLFADLGVDPATHGCQSYEATDFLLRRRRFDPSVPLVLWQVHMIGERNFRPEGCDRARIQILAEVLGSHYGTSHEVVCYQSPQLPIQEPTLTRVPLSDLGTHAELIWTLYVPPREQPNVDSEMVLRLGLSAALG